MKRSKPTTGRARSAQYSRLDEISKQIKLIEQERNGLFFSRVRPGGSRVFGVMKKETFLYPKNEQEAKRVSELWKRQAELSAEYVAILKENGVAEGYARWWKRTQNKPKRSALTPQVKVEWKGTLAELATHMVGEYDQHNYRSKLAACEGGCKRYTYKGRSINPSTLYQYMKGR